MPGSQVYLRKIRLAEIAVVDTLLLQPDELKFAGGPAQQIASRIANHPCPDCHNLFLICHDHMMVGFVCLREGRARPEWASRDAVTLHNLRVAKTWRGRGFGRATIKACLHWISINSPETPRLELSVNEANQQAMLLYQRCGFVFTGSSHAGRLGRQIIMSIPVTNRSRQGQSRSGLGLRFRGPDHSRS